VKANGAESAPWRQALFEAETRRDRRQQGLLRTPKAESRFSVQYLCIHKVNFIISFPVISSHSSNSQPFSALPSPLHCVSQPLTQRKSRSYSGPYHATRPDTQRRNLELKIAEDVEDISRAPTEQ